MPKKRRKSYPPGVPGKWFVPHRKGYKTSCCDCGLVHVFKFRLRRSGPKAKRPWVQVEMQVNRDERATAACRRHRPLAEFTSVLKTVKKKVGRGFCPVIRYLHERHARKKK